MIIRGTLSQTFNLLLGMRTGKKQEEIKKNGVNRKNSHSVRQLTLSGKAVATYVSLASAGRKTGILPGGISNCLKGKCLSAGGFLWEYP